MKARMRFHMRAGVARTWPISPSITPPKVAKVEEAGASSCMENPMSDKELQIASLPSLVSFSFKPIE
jgi:hypothetical protein